MKNIIKLLGIIALVAVIGFSMAACSNPAGGSGGSSSGGTSGGTSSSDGKTTYSYSDAEGNAYKLVITQAGRAAHKEGDTYVLTITFKDGKVQTSTGTVEKFENNQLTLKTSDGDKEFQVKVDGKKIAAIAGDNLPFDLPDPKRVTITGFTRWQGKPENNNGDYYRTYGVFLIADLNKLYDGWFPIVDALWYTSVTTDDDDDDDVNVNFDLIIPVDNTWNYGRMPWTGKGDYYVVIMPCVSPRFYEDDAKIYTNGTANPVKVTINSQTTTLEFNKFGDWD